MVDTRAREAMTVERVSVSALHEDPSNVRKHSRRNLDTIKGSLARFGQRKPIVVGPGNIVVAGNGTLRAAVELGWTEIDAVRTSLTGPEAAAFAIADNRTAELAEWDDGPLAELLLALSETDHDLAAASGFSDAELRGMVAGINGAGPVDEDDAPEPPTDPVTRLGDIWALGEHRLLCGDSSNATDVARATDGRHCALIATDPPYGVAYGVETGVGNKYEAIANDENDGPRLQSFLESVFAAALPHLRENAAWYLWHAQMTQGFFAAAAAAAAAVQIHRQIVWVKPSLVLGHGDYHWRHELCFYGWRKGKRPEWYGDRCQTTVWEIGRENDKIHPTQKPVELFARPIRFNTKSGDDVYEPFGGSGTQYIAAEQLGRRCCGLELDPRYCDVIVERWQNITGKQASRNAA